MPTPQQQRDRRAYCRAIGVCTDCGRPSHRFACCLRCRQRRLVKEQRRYRAQHTHIRTLANVAARARYAAQKQRAA